MNNVVFRTQGDWDTTTLENNGQQVFADELFVEMHAGRDEYGNPVRGGVSDSGEMTAFIRPQENPDQEMPIFPGHLEIDFPGHRLVLENVHPAFAFEFTRVWYNGQDVTNHVMDIYVDVNSVENIVKAYITLYKAHWFGSDEVATYNIFG